MTKKEIILIGGGGHCKSCIEVITSTDEYTIAGIVDVKEKVGTTILGYPIIGSDEDLPQLKEKYNVALVTVGQIKTSTIRKKIFEALTALEFELPAIVAKSAVVSEFSKLAPGTIVMHQAMVNANTSIGKNCIINSKALIEHDCVVGNHTHISTNATLNGEVKVGNDCFVGSNSSFLNGVTVGDEVIIGINSVIVNNISEKGTYWGSPIQKIRWVKKR